MTSSHSTSPEAAARWPGVFAVFEGIDGSGKSTALRLTAERLRGAGRAVLTSREPTDGPWGAALRRSMTAGRMTPQEELRHFLLDRREHIEGAVLPALHEGQIVLVDRYYLSTAAYQGRRGFDVDDLLAQNEAFAPAPDVAFLFRIAPERALQRARSRGATDEFERLDELREVAAIFDAIDRPWIVRVDADRPVADVVQHVVSELVEGPLRARACAGATLCTGLACVEPGRCPMPTLRRDIGSGGTTTPILD